MAGSREKEGEGESEVGGVGEGKIHGGRREGSKEGGEDK